MEVKQRSSLSHARFGRGCSLAELARLAGVSTSTLSRVELGVREPCSELRAFLAGYFGFDPLAPTLGARP